MVKICDTKYPSEHTKYNDKFSEYPFELDHFQKYAIEGIEEGKHVLVTAHTGSGKTLPGEHAIKKFCEEGKKVIYTSPIKSLSNQKYYEFTEKFPEISFGILTGDVKFNPEADCLIMTTEILRNTLFQKEAMDNDKETEYNLHFDMDIRNELACVIFDEVHYINDADRGKVWEETIMKMPKHVQMVMLSATIDRSESFASWIETIKEREVWISSTNIRVVPLIHYTYYQFNQQTYKKTTDKKMKLLMENIDSKIKPIKIKHEDINFENVDTMDKCDYHLKKNRLFVTHKHVFNKIIPKLKENNMLPAICFVFSRKKVEEYAEYIEQSLFNEDESHFTSLIEKECKNVLRKLPNHNEYINMPEFVQMIKLLEKGIAIHHSGILPILREMVELLFSKGYIKLLFATETFAVGINMPTKTVLFTSLKKFDGSNMRYLLPHEYTQMAGRAGRRGLDPVGHVIHLNNMFEIPSGHEYKHVLCGTAQALVSKFKIHFNIILKLISTQSTDFDSFIGKSMMGDEINKDIDVMKSILDELKTNANEFMETMKLMSTDIEELKEYHNLKNNLTMVKPKKRKAIQRQLLNIEQSVKSFKTDYQQYLEYLEIKSEINKNERNIEEANGYINWKINDILKILTEYGYTILNGENKYGFTVKGLVANSIQEVNGICFAELITNKVFENILPEQFASILASFTNIRVKDDYKRYTSSYDEYCDSLINYKIKDTFNKYYDIELRETKCINNQDYDIIYDINQEVYDWCLAKNEEECKVIIGKLYEKEIFVGEFVKALMKINNICSELEKTCDLIGDIKFKSMLSKIPVMTLKYIATNQSLYI